MQKKNQHNKISKSIQVLVPVPIAGVFDYAVPDTRDVPEIGAFVRVPFGQKTLTGIVWAVNESDKIFDFKLKEILETLQLPTLSQEQRRFISWVAGYTLFPLGSVLKMVLSVEKELEKSKNATRKTKELTFAVPDLTHTGVTLSDKQQYACTELQSKIGHGFNVTVLDGVTGSGKTEVYFEAIARTLEQGKQVLVLLPEIGLTGQWLERFKRRFNVMPALWHSGLTPKTRRDTWKAVLSSDLQVLAGARSALFLPFSNLGLIIVDEEHDASYKQEEGVIYQARDMAVVRASLGGFSVILSSATPSLETVMNIKTGRYGHVVLPKRFGGAEMPEISLIDLRKNPPEKADKNQHNFLSPILIQEIKKTLEAGNQALLFLNRRGYAPLVLCRKCGHRFCCPQCSAWLVEHQFKKGLQCHHCGYVLPIPKVCPVCESDEDFASIGSGVERISEEAFKHFQNARQIVITSDLDASASELSQMMRSIHDHEFDLIIGTQMLAKGHHFPHLTLVGVIDADLGLAGGDLRASERTYQMLHQVAGRAGREQKKGRVFLQTFDPENAVIKALTLSDMSAFLDAEISAREMLKMPPFGRMAGVIISGSDRDKTFSFARRIAAIAPVHKEIRVLGPAPAPLALLRGKYRFRLLVQTSKEIKIQDVLQRWFLNIQTPSSMRVQIDIDPYSFF